jgi:tetratricopeptide (TPR) repeat protein
VKALIRKARSLDALKLYQNAIQAYEEARKHDSSNSAQLTKDIQQCKQVLFKEDGDSLLMRGLFEQAEVSFTNALDISTEPQDVILLRNQRALALLKQYKYGRCLKDCNSAIETYNNNRDSSSTSLMKKSKTDVRKQFIEILVCKSQALNALKDYQEAIKVYDMLWNLSDRDIKTISCVKQCQQNLLREEGNLLFKKKQFGQAEKTYSRAINCLPQRHGDLILFWNNRAAAFMEQGEYESCLNDCESAIELARMNVPNGLIMKITETTVASQLSKACIRKTRALEALSKYQEAIQAYKEALKHNPNDVQLKQGLKECKLGF